MTCAVDIVFTPKVLASRLRHIDFTACRFNRDGLWEWSLTSGASRSEMNLVTAEPFFTLLALWAVGGVGDLGCILAWRFAA